jgi:hypothetical protein
VERRGKVQQRTQRGLLQGYQGAEAAGAAFFGTVRIPVFGVAGSADAGDFDLSDPCMFECVPVGCPQVEMDFPVMRFEEQL